MTSRFKFSAQTIRVLAASAIALGLVPLTAQADDRVNCVPYYHRDASQQMPAHMKSLNLTAEQQEKFRAIETAHREIMRKNMELLSTNKVAERELVEAPNFDEQKAQKLATQDAKIMGDNNLATLRFRHEIYQILTPEQRAKFDAMRKQRIDNKRP
jgi:protein CpxP